MQPSPGRRYYHAQTPILLSPSWFDRVSGKEAYNDITFVRPDSQGQGGTPFGGGYLNSPAVNGSVSSGTSSRL